MNQILGIDSYLSRYGLTIDEARDILANEIVVACGVDLLDGTSLHTVEISVQMFFESIRCGWVLGFRKEDLFGLILGVCGVLLSEGFSLDYSTSECCVGFRRQVGLFRQEIRGMSEGEIIYDEESRLLEMIHSYMVLVIQSAELGLRGTYYQSLLKLIRGGSNVFPRVYAPRLHRLVVGVLTRMRNPNHIWGYGQSDTVRLHVDAFYKEMVDNPLSAPVMIQVDHEEGVSSGEIPAVPSGGVDRALMLMDFLGGIPDFSKMLWAYLRYASDNLEHRMVELRESVDLVNAYIRDNVTGEAGENIIRWRNVLAKELDFLEYIDESIQLVGSTPVDLILDDTHEDAVAILIRYPAEEESDLDWRIHLYHKVCFAIQCLSSQQYIERVRGSISAVCSIIPSLGYGLQGLGTQWCNLLSRDIQRVRTGGYGQPVKVSDFFHDREVPLNRFEILRRSKNGG